MAPAPPKNFWGPPTSTLDWCEINYEVSPFVAEFWNTFSNLGMIVPSVFGIYEIVRLGLERKFIYTHLCLIAVGIGSWLFHMTLMYSMQLLDEIPMIFGNVVLIYQLAEIRKSIRKPVNPALIFACCSYAFFFVVFYLAFKNPLIHQVMYGAGVLVVLALDLRLVNYNQCRTCTKLLSAGFFMYTFGFGLWNIDNQLCAQLTSPEGSGWTPSQRGQGDLRTKLPKPLGPFTQLHAWWHILAGYATYMHILFEIHARSHFIKPRTQITLKYFGISVEPMYRHRNE